MKIIKITIFIAVALVLSFMHTEETFASYKIEKVEDDERLKMIIKAERDSRDNTIKAFMDGTKETKETEETEKNDEVMKDEEDGGQEHGDNMGDKK